MALFHRYRGRRRYGDRNGLWARAPSGPAGRQAVACVGRPSAAGSSGTRAWLRRSSRSVVSSAAPGLPTAGTADAHDDHHHLPGRAVSRLARRMRRTVKVYEHPQHRHEYHPEDQLPDRPPLLVPDLPPDSSACRDQDQGNSHALIVAAVTELSKPRLRPRTRQKRIWPWSCSHASSAPRSSAPNQNQYTPVADVIDAIFDVSASPMHPRDHPASAVCGEGGPGAGHNLVTGICQVEANRAPRQPAVHPWGWESAASPQRRGGNRALSATTRP
jgi:hypothetical protein